MAALSYLIAPVWETCQNEQLGYFLDIEGIYIPFLFFCDNLYILAHCGEDFQQIVLKIRSALAVGGWRLPDERVQWQANSFVRESAHPAVESWKMRPFDASFKSLGSMVNVRGVCQADIVFKKQLCKSGLQANEDLWRSGAGSRSNKMKLMLRIAMGTVGWSLGPWRVTKRDLMGLNGMMLAEYRRCAHMPKFWGESDTQYHARLGRLVKTVRTENRMQDLDGYVLGRIYDYAGHTIRAGARDAENLPYIVLRHRDKEWCAQHYDVLGHQGHPGRVHPWTYERQFHHYFGILDLDWKTVAIDKKRWTNHRNGWIKSWYEGQSSTLKVSQGLDSTS